jgi:hypothetical protein
MHYDIEYVAAQVGWSGRRRWVVGMVVFPVNLAVVTAYAIRRRASLQDDRGVEHPEKIDESDGPRNLSGYPGANVLIVACVLVWVAVLSLDTLTVGQGGAVALVILGVWVLLPLVTFLDIRSLTGTNWEPKRAYWVLGALLPIANIVVAIVYLLRRHETLRRTEEA